MWVLLIFLFYTALFSCLTVFWFSIIYTGLQLYRTITITVTVTVTVLLFTYILDILGYNKKNSFLSTITDMFINIFTLVSLLNILLLYTDYFFQESEYYLFIYTLISTVLSIVILLLCIITIYLEYKISTL